MTPERLAEIRKFAVETIPNILKQKREAADRARTGQTSPCDGYPLG